MANDNAPQDDNYRPAIIAEANDASGDTVVLWADPTTHRLLVDSLIEGSFGEDTAHQSGDVGLFVLAVRQDTATQLAGADGDYSPLITDANGRLHVLDANTAAIKTAVELIDNAISGSEMQVDIVAVTPDLMLGTDFSNVFGTASLVSATPAIKVEEQGTVTVQATNLDIRDIDAATDDITVFGSQAVALQQKLTSNDLIVTLDGETITVTATQLDIDNLNATDDIVTVTGGAGQTADVKVTLDSETVVLGAGSAAIGKLAANSGVDIGDVDVTSIPGTAAEAAALPSVFVVVAGDDGTDTQPIQLNASGHLKVDISTDSVGIGGGTQYTEDAVAAANPVGTQPVMVRQDTPATLVSADGDVVGQRATNYGAAYVQVLTSTGSFVDSFGGSGGTSHADDAAFTIGSASSITPAGYLADDTTPDSVDEGDVGVPRMSLNRIPYAILRDAAGNERGVNVDASNRLTVVADLGATDNAVLDAIEADTTTIAGAVAGTEMQVDVVASLPAGTNAIGKLAANTGVDIGDVDVTSVIPGTGATNLGKAIDSVAGATDSGVAILAVRDDALSALTPIEGDYAPLRVDGNGALWVHDDALDAAISGSELQVDIVGALPAGTNAIGKLAANTGVDIGDVDVTSIVPGTGATNLGKAEDGAHTSGDVGVMPLGVRNDTPNAALAGTDLDYSPFALYRTGAVRVAPPEEDFAALGSNSVKKYYTSAGAVTDGIIWSPAAGKRWYVTDIFINISAAATITLEDDLAAGDSAVWKAELAANSGWSHSFSTPLFSGEDAADLIITTSAGNVYVTVTGYEI